VAAIVARSAAGLGLAFIGTGVGGGACPASLGSRPLARTVLDDRFAFPDQGTAHGACRSTKTLACDAGLEPRSAGAEAEQIVLAPARRVPMGGFHSMEAAAAICRRPKGSRQTTLSNGHCQPCRQVAGCCRYQAVV